MSRARRIATGIVVLLLFLPASASIPTVQLHIHHFHRLRELKRNSPDSQLDYRFRRLLPYLPAEGAVGFQNVGAPDASRTYYQAQYALVPRQLRQSTRPEFVVELGPADAAKSLWRDPRFAIVTSPADDLRLFRRIQ